MDVITVVVATDEPARQDEATSLIATALVRLLRDERVDSRADVRMYAVVQHDEGRQE